MIEGAGRRYRVTAAMTFATAAALFEEGRGLLPAEGEVTIDLQAVPAADSAALAVLLGWQRHTGGRLRLTNPPASIVSLAQLYDLPQPLPTLP